MTLDSDTQPATAPKLDLESASTPVEAERPDRLGQWLQSKPVFGVIMLVIGLLVGYFGRPAWEARTSTTAASDLSSVSNVQGPQPLPQSQEELLPFLISQTRHWRGNPAAPVTLIEFADFQCPFCSHYAATADSQIQQQYVENGRVRIGYQHFAFLGQESFWAAEASECAADQNAFWDYHDYLFAHQNGENQGAFAQDNLKRFAGELGLDQDQFNACVDSGKYTNFVAGQTHSLQSLGVQSTPTFVVNDQVLVGALDFSEFQKAIEQALSK
jgi:protein-disulfide isomerase